jgi:hypothetical protein
VIGVALLDCFLKMSSTMRFRLTSSRASRNRVNDDPAVLDFFEVVTGVVVVVVDFVVEDGVVVVEGAGRFTADDVELLLVAFVPAVVVVVVFFFTTVDGKPASAAERFPEDIRWRMILLLIFFHQTTSVSYWLKSCLLTLYISQVGSIMIVNRFFRLNCKKKKKKKERFLICGVFFFSLSLLLNNGLILTRLFIVACHLMT